MSSFIGHSLAAVTVYVGTEFLVSTPVKPTRVKLSKIIWLAWLVVVASIPDLDYIVSAWNSTNNDGLRITHSILFSLIVPCVTVAVLLALKQAHIWRRALEVVLASLSHLWLDLLVGVTPLPLLFPLVKISYKLPFGILSSAGRIDLNNYYFYRNLWLEMGVLLPIFCVVSLLSLARISWHKIHPLVKSGELILMVLMLCCAGYFIAQNLQLPR